MTAYKGDNRSPSICNNCIDMCNQIIAERNAVKGDDSNDQETR